MRNKSTRVASSVLKAGIGHSPGVPPGLCSASLGQGRDLHGSQRPTVEAEILHAARKVRVGPVLRAAQPVLRGGAQLVGEIYSMIMGLLHDVRFLRDPQAVSRTEASWARLVKSYTNGSPP